MTPSNSGNFLTVQVAVLFVEHERGECFSIRWGFEYFSLGAASNKEELRVGTERHCCDLISKVKVGHYDFALHVNDQ